MYMYYNTLCGDLAVKLQTMAMDIQRSTSCPCHSRKCAIWGLTNNKIRGYSLSVALVKTMK